MTYPFEFREHVLGVQKREGLSFSETAKRFDIGVSSLVRWKNRIEPKRKKNRPWLRINRHRLAEDIRVHPDAYQHERAQRLGVARRSIGDALRRIGVTYKKNDANSKSRSRKIAQLPNKD